MRLELNRRALDLGIVTADAPAMLAFYCDTLGLTLVAEVPIPGGVVKKLQCGDSYIKMLVLEEPPKNALHRGGYAGATGYRYCALSVRNLDAVVAACRAAGYRVVVDVRELRPGVKVALVEDPDGNTLEFMQEN
jgi:catechol 2,3-dioxygenase-like lactoylglutathione lyase family enzyme